MMNTLEDLAYHILEIGDIGRGFAQRAHQHEWENKDLAIIAEGVNGIWITTQAVALLLLHGLREDDAKSMELLRGFFGDTPGQVEVDDA